MVVAMVLTLFAGLTITSHADTATFNKVDTITSGKQYLLVYNGLAFDSANAADNVVAVSVTDNDGVISADAGLAVTITSSATAGKFNVLCSNGKYIGRSANSNGMDLSDSAIDVTIEASGTAYQIKGEGGRCLGCNTGNGNKWRFFAASNAYTKLDFYELDDSGSSSGDCDHADAEFHAEEPSTCTVAGVSAYWYCPDCDKYFADNNGSRGSVISTAGTELPLAEHSWDEVDSVASTCTVAGHIDYECTVCHTEKTENLPLAAHNYVSGVCSVCGAAEPAGYELTATLSDGEYVFGVVKGTVGTDTAIGAVKGELSGTWGAYTVLTPENGLIASADDIEIWTLTNVTGGITLQNKSTGKYLSLPTGTGSGSGVPSFSDSAVTIYTSVVSADNSTFKLHPTDSSTNQLACNFGSGYGYRMYATRNQGTDSGICVEIRFYKAGSSSVTPSCDHADAEFTAEVPSTCTVAGTSAYWYCPDCDQYFADNNGVLGAVIATAGTPLELAAHNYEWDGDDAVNGEHTLVCSECQDSITEACTDGDSDGYCDVCSTEMPATPVSSDYELATTLEDGDYVFGAVQGPVGTDTAIGAVKGELSGTWGAYTVVTPANGVIAAADVNDIEIWTLTNVTGGITLQNKSTGKYLSLPTGTGSGSGVPSFSDSAVTIYTSVVSADNSTFKLHPTDSSTNQLACNFGSGYGYRMYATRNQATNTTGICVEIRFYKAASAPISCSHDDIEFVAAVASTCTVAGNIAYWYCPDCDQYFADDNGQAGSKIAAASVALALAEHNWEETETVPSTCSQAGYIAYECSVCHTEKTEDLPLAAHNYEWDGDDAVNGYHKLVCSVCSGETTEACTDGDGDGYCDVCSTEMPEVVTYTLSDELHDGDKVVIYHPTSGKAISITASGTKLAGVDVAPSNGALVVEDATVAIFTVAFVDDTNFTLVDQNGNYLTSGQTGNALSLGAESDTLSQWNLSTLGSSKVGIRSTGANYNGNYNQALEYYNGFTTYGWKDNNNAYIFELYTVVSQSAHVHDWDQGTITTAATCEAEGVMTYECVDCSETKTEPIPMIAHVDANSDGVCDNCSGTIYAKATALNEGDSVVIYNPNSGMAMTKTASGTRLAGLATNVQGGVAVKSDSDLAVLTVEYDDATNFYLKDADGKYLTTAETGNALTLEETATDYSLWYLSSDETGITIINKNALYNEKVIAIEFYGSNFTGYSMSAAGDAFYMELYTLAAPAPVVGFSGASLSMNDAIEINFYVEGVDASNAADYTVDLTGPSGNITGAALQLSANGYRVSYPVYAKDYGATVTATLKQGNTTIASGTYSVQEYLTSQESAADQNLAALIKAAEDFGFYAAANFGTDANITEPNNDLSDIDASTLANYAASADSLEDLDPADGVNFYGASLLLEEKTTLRFWFRIADDNAAGNYSAVIGSDTYDLIRSGNTKYYYFDVTGIVAKDLDKAVDFVLMNGETAVLTLTGYSPLTYCQQVLKNGPAETQNLCRALYKYWEAANTYFG